MHQSLIHFFKRIPEFKGLDLNLQILLIKSNLVDVIHLHHIIVQNFQEIPQIGTHMSKWISPDFHQQMSRTRGRFDCFMKYPLILQLTLTVFVFSINLSTPRTNNHFIDNNMQSKLYQIQNFYISILWRYLTYLFGAKEAVRSMQIIVMQILRYQTLMSTMDEIVRQNNDYDIFSPLMQSVFGLT